MSRRSRIFVLLCALVATRCVIAQVCINEIHLGAVDWCELANLGTTSVDLSGALLLMNDDPFASTPFTFPPGTTLTPGTTLVVTESTSQPIVAAGSLVFISSPIYWAANSGGAVGLFGAASAVLDAVFFNAAINLPAGTTIASFSGPLASQGELLFRHANVDTDSAADFSTAAQGPPSPGALNPGQIPPQAAVPTAAFNLFPAQAITGEPVHFVDVSLGQPTSWAWDFDGDGTIDATDASPTHTFAATGSFAVTLTVQNAVGSHALTLPGAVQVAAPASVSAPHTADFDGVVGAEWLLLPDLTAGWAAIDPQVAIPSPGSGANALLLASTTPGVMAENSAVLLLDGLTPPGTLTYSLRNLNEGSDPEDGVFLTTTSGPLVPLASHAGYGAFWSTVTIDLASAITTAGLGGVGDLRLVFRQRGDQPPPFGGAYVDDIQVAAAVPQLGQANQAAATLVLPGAVNASGQTPAIGVNGPFFAQGTTLDFTISGDPLRPIVLLFGPLSPTNFDFGPPGALDLGLMGAQLDFSDIVVLMAGGESSWTGLFAYTDASGSASFSWSLAGLPPGPLGGFQSLIQHQGAAVVSFSAAFGFDVE